MVLRMGRGCSLPVRWHVAPFGNQRQHARSTELFTLRTAKTNMKRKSKQVIRVTLPGGAKHKVTITRARTLLARVQASNASTRRLEFNGLLLTKRAALELARYALAMMA